MSAREWIDAMNAGAEAKGDPVKVAKATVEVEWEDGTWRRYTSIEPPEDFKMLAYLESEEVSFATWKSEPPRPLYDLNVKGLSHMTIEGRNPDDE